jgi:hypothetical protein
LQSDLSDLKDLNQKKIKKQQLVFTILLVNSKKEPIGFHDICNEIFMP